MNESFQKSIPDITETPGKSSIACLSAFTSCWEVFPSLFFCCFADTDADDGGGDGNDDGDCGSDDSDGDDSEDDDSDDDGDSDDAYITLYLLWPSNM